MFNEINYIENINPAYTDALPGYGAAKGDMLSPRLLPLSQPLPKLVKGVGPEPSKTQSA